MIQEGTILKLPNLTRVQGRVLTVFAAAAFLLPGCDSGGDEGGTTDTDSATSESDTNDDTTGANTTTDTDASASGTTEDPTEDSTTESEDESSSGPPPAGLGCGEPPACDRGVFDGSIRIESADQIDDIAGYTSVDGFLEVFQSDLTCLDFLACVETVSGDMTIFGNDFLTDVSGTDAITALGTATADLPEEDKRGTLVFSENSAIEDLNGFNGLEQVQATLLIAENESMTSISGFEALVGARKDFQVRFNSKLTDIASSGLRDILFIGGECIVTNNESLCISTVESMCGDLKQGPNGGSTVNNDEGC